MRESRDCDCELDCDFILACEAEWRRADRSAGDVRVRTGLGFSDSDGRYQRGVDHGNSSSPKRKWAGEYGSGLSKVSRGNVAACRCGRIECSGDMGDTGLRISSLSKEGGAELPRECCSLVLIPCRLCLSCWNSLYSQFTSCSKSGVSMVGCVGIGGN